MYTSELRLHRQVSLSGYSRMNGEFTQHSLSRIHVQRDGSHESTTSLRLLGRILTFLRLKVSTFVFAFLQDALQLFTEKIKFSLLIDWWFCMDF